MTAVLVFLCVVLFPTVTFGAVAFDAAGSADTAGETTATSVSFAFTCANSNTALYVTAHIRDGTSTPSTVTAITYNGLTLANFTDVSTRTTPTSGTRNLTLSIWRALPGAACDGASHTLQVTISQSKLWGAGAISLTGVNATAPDDAPVVVATDGTPAVDGSTGTVTSETGDLVLGCVARRNTNTLTEVAGQTDRYNHVTDSATGSNNVRGICATEPGAATVTVQWTSGGSSQEWVTTGVNVNQVSTRRRFAPPSPFLRLPDIHMPFFARIDP